MLPVQRDKVATMQYAGLAIAGAIGKRIHTENTFIRVFQSGSRISQMPGYVYHSAHYYDLVQNKKAYGVQLGVNVDWRYDWPSETFNPLNGQWFLQNKTTIPPYFLVNAFANVRIDRVRLYFKVHNVLQKLGSPGYFATPFYPGQRRLFEFGLNWTFFD
jgi:outer membrane receptor protein involved in Fe transport